MANTSAAVCVALLSVARQSAGTPGWPPSEHSATRHLEKPGAVLLSLQRPSGSARLEWIDPQCAKPKGLTVKH